MLVCNETVWIDSERVVPRERRADWLEKHGLPGDKLPFNVSAPARAWVAAGCYLTSDGKVKRVSKEAIDALCVPARNLVRDHYPVRTIPRFAAERALRIAAARRKRTDDEKRQRDALMEQSAQAASRWVEEHGTAQMKRTMRDGADARKIVVRAVWLSFVRYLGIEPMRSTPRKSRRVTIQVAFRVRSVIRLLTWSKIFRARALYASKYSRSRECEMPRTVGLSQRLSR